MIVWSLDNRFVLAAIMGKVLQIFEYVLMGEKLYEDRILSHVMGEKL
jgi:hypothetical protein